MSPGRNVPPQIMLFISLGGSAARQHQAPGGRCARSPALPSFPCAAAVAAPGLGVAAATAPGQRCVDRSHSVTDISVTQERIHRRLLS
ncbi:Mitogen-Activated Protein Kinase Kinase Kinase 5 [Manis pentadactyla]|nr:Mitogen-Activated Protein Kinase Kinase Kinase 5 [Manis pentadactyla]